MTFSKFVKLLIPTVRQALVSLALSLSILALVFQSLILPHLVGDNALSPYLDSGKQISLAGLNQFSFVRIGVEGLFWAIVGLCAYLVYLGLINAVVEARNEVILTTEFANKGSFSTWVRSVRFQAALVAVLIIGLIMTAKFGINYWFELVGRLIINGASWGHILAAGAGVLGLAVNIYLLWILGEAAVTADR